MALNIPWLKNLNTDDIRRLVDRFQVSVIASLRTPWEEWVGFHLNIAEAVSVFDQNKAVEKINEIYRIINTDIWDFDIKIFCYARLWGTFKNLDLKNDEDVKNNLERVLSHLLKHAALHGEILNKTLRILAGIDIEYALDIADRMNTEDRRNLGKKIAIINGYRKQPNKEFHVQLRRVLKGLDVFQQDDLMYELVEELSDRKINIDSESQRIIYFRTREISNEIDKSIISKFGIHLDKR